MSRSDFGRFRAQVLRQFYRPLGHLTLFFPSSLPRPRYSFYWCALQNWRCRPLLIGNSAVDPDSTQGSQRIPTLNSGDYLTHSRRKILSLPLPICHLGLPRWGLAPMYPTTRPSLELASLAKGNKGRKKKKGCVGGTPGLSYTQAYLRTHVREIYFGHRCRPPCGYPISNAYQAWGKPVDCQS